MTRRDRRAAAPVIVTPGRPELPHRNPADQAVIRAAESAIGETRTDEAMLRQVIDGLNQLDGGAGRVARS